jgi:hypothetical protein
MAEKNESHLRAVPVVKDAEAAVRSTSELEASPLAADATTAGVADAVEGFDRIGKWMDQMEEIVAGISVTGVEKTRGDIRELIEKLLRINAELQNVARLKKLLS